jgi:hypothetical protein
MQRLRHLSERQCSGSKVRWQPDSLGWVQHGNRGRSMPWAVSIPRRQLILSLARGQYQGFNDSHLTEKLRLGREPRRQPRDRAPPLAGRESSVSAEAPASSIPLSAPTPPATRNDFELRHDLELGSRNW